MEPNDYQEFCKSTAVYPNIGENLIYPVLGLAGEVGELQEKIVQAILESNYTILDDSAKIDPKILTEMLQTYSEIGLKQNKLKKLIRDSGFAVKFHYNILPERVKNAMKAECGDIKWYCCMIDSELQSTSQEIIDQNIKKLSKRKSEGTIKGSGDTIRTQ